MDNTLKIAHVFDPATGMVSAMPAGRWTDNQRKMYEAAAQAAGLQITYTATPR